jgi:hypothetical protein
MWSSSIVNPLILFERHDAQYCHCFVAQWRHLTNHPLCTMASSCGAQDTSCKECHHVTIGLTMMKRRNDSKSNGGFNNNVAKLFKQSEKVKQKEKPKHWQFQLPMLLLLKVV